MGESGQRNLCSIQLCTTCENLTIKQYFIREIHREPAKYELLVASDDANCLGPLAHIYEKSANCNLCYLVAKSLGFVNISNSLSAIPSESHPDPVIKCWIFSYCCAHSSQENINIKAHRHRIATRTKPNRSMPYMAGEIQLSSQSATGLGLSHLYHSRSRAKPEFNVSIAQKWLEICETEHGPWCVRPGRKVEDRVLAPEPVELFAIDLDTMWICLMPPGSRFVALSYCWPAERYFTLTKSTLQEALNEGSIFRNMIDLPWTIRDAISFTKELVFRYLWIDALCITQDDQKHKSRQLGQMDRVYGSATLTLVAAYPVPESSSDPCRGLPGYRTDTRRLDQKFRNVNGLELTVPSISVWSVLDYCRWDNRSWAFQEGLLSRRILYFTHVQIYFQCSCAVFCEDIEGEMAHRTDFVHPGNTVWNQKCPYALDKYAADWGSWWLSRTPLRGFVEAMPAYENLLGDYTARQMTNEGDILNAFEGIMAVLRTSMNTEFWFGLPERYFDLALGWTLRGRSRRRNAVVKQGSDQQFPSWSWTGWSSMIVQGQYFATKLYKSEIEGFIMNSNGEAVSLSTTTPRDVELEYEEGGNKRVTPHIHDYDAFGTIVPRLYIDVNADEWKFAPYLACWTTCATFKLDAEVQLQPERQSRGNHLMDLVIWDSGGRRAGTIMLDTTFIKDIHEDGQMFEFVLVTRLEQNDGYDAFADEVVYPARDWCYLSIMLIEREGDTAERVSIGVIHEDTWVEAKPQTLFVKLK